MTRVAQELAGRAALVTGASQGIGRATALALAAEGARVAVNDRVGSPALTAIAGQTGGPEVVCDMADPAAVAAALAAADAELGGIDILVSNHAVLSKARLLDHDPDAWWRDIDVNLSGAWHAVQAVMPGMIERGYGRIVLMASCWGITGEPLCTAYSASKAGIISLTRSLALELAPHGIAVNAVAPGTVDTPQLEIDAEEMQVPLDEAKRVFAGMTPLGRIAAPEEIARTIAYLSSERAGAMVGQVLQPNGGIITGRG